MQWDEFTVEERTAVVRVAIYAVATVILVRTVLRVARNLDKDATVYRDAFVGSENRVSELEQENEQLRAALADFEPEHERPPNMFKPGTALHDAVERGTSQSP